MQNSKFSHNPFCLSFHFRAVSKTLEVQAGVDEKERKASPERDTVFLCLPSSRLNVQENLSFAFSEREGEHIGGVAFLPISAVYFSRRCVGAENK